jgi:hypothetical protein
MAKYDHAIDSRPVHESLGEDVGTPVQFTQDENPEEGRLLISPVFWIGGLLAILSWVGIAAFFGFF